MAASEVINLYQHDIDIAEGDISSSSQRAKNILLISRRKSRPRSTPVAHRRAQYVSSPASMHRPCTAAAVLEAPSSNCHRVYQLEHEATRCHNLESHLPTKRNKPPAWQKNMEQPLVPFVVGPGYILSRSKTKCAVTIKDEFFDVRHDVEQKKKHVETERDFLMAQLQQQISDLSLYLEEERLNHKQTKQKAEEYLRDRLDKARAQHQDHTRDLEAQHKEDMQKQRAEQEEEFAEYQSITENQIHRLSKEVELLQGAFESYKSTLHQETEDKWRAKEDELKQECEASKLQAVQELKNQLMKERLAEKSALIKDHNRQLDNLRKEHKKEQDALIRKFSNAAADLERLQRATAELEETRQELKQLKESYDETCQQLANTTRSLTDTKVRLMDLEQRFQEKVTEVDDKYRLKLQDLMTQNTELRRLYVQKCGELHEIRTEKEGHTMGKILSAKATLETLIRSKHKANVSIAMLPEVNRPVLPDKMRPSSAPGTKVEAELAYYSAGKTDHLHKVEEFVRPDHVIPPEDPETEKLRQELLATDVRQITKEDLLNSFNV